MRIEKQSVTQIQVDEKEKKNHLPENGACFNLALLYYSAVPSLSSTHTACRNQILDCVAEIAIFSTHTDAEVLHTKSNVFWREKKHFPVILHH